jgi:quercetin dioxygenase-like cupin family protein
MTIESNGEKPKIFWQVGRGEIHEIPEGAVIYIQATENIDFENTGKFAILKIIPSKKKRNNENG